MKKLIEFAKKIKNKKLQKKVFELLKDPKISNSEILYPTAKYAKVPSWIGAHHDYEGGLLDHTVGVVQLSLDMAKTFEKIYKAKVNYYYLIAGALLHDVAKVWILKKDAMWNMTGALLDHGQFSACELYARNFPEEVIHIVAAHGGDMGQAAANPRTLEAWIVFQADVLDAAGESQIRGVPDPLKDIQFMLMPDK